MAARRVEGFTNSLHAELVRVATEHGVDDSRAVQIAVRVVERIAQQYQGAEPYVSQPQRYDAQAVLRDFDYRNHDAVCAKHGISRRTLYRILRRHKRI